MPPGAMEKNMEALFGGPFQTLPLCLILAGYDCDLLL